MMHPHRASMNDDANRAGCARPTVRPRIRLQFFWMAAITGLLAGAELQAQLAITEAMSWASTNCVGCPETANRGCRPDFWEVTNFGNEPIDLQGHLYIDKDGLFPDAGWRIDRQVIVQPNESVIFFRSGWDLVPDVQAFRDWWGSNLATEVQIICCYPMQGLDERGDGVRLFDPEGQLTDYMFFGETRRGFTFAYDPNTGDVLQSQLGVCGAFQAESCTDIGSPGRHCGPVALQLTLHPTNQTVDGTNLTVDAGSDVTLHVRAIGLPRPRYQWFFNGAALTNSNAVATSVPRLVGVAGCGPAWMEPPVPPDLTILNVQPIHAGDYFVEVSNGLEKLTSAVVRLTVNTNPNPVLLECPPVPACGVSMPSLVVAPGQDAILSVFVRGNPQPTFQWSMSADGLSFDDLPEETNRVLRLHSVDLDDAGLYRVRVQNPGGVTNAFITLHVQQQPKLRITEVMPDVRHLSANDWWELTNLDDKPVNLCGYRWDDEPGNIGGGPTINDPVIIKPGESVIFLEGLTPEFFIQWWGASNLPPGLQFIVYTANGFESDGDEIVLWNPTAIDDTDLIDSVVFSTATRGASFWFDPTVPCSLFPFGVTNAPDRCGAFRSVEAGDVGSPGWTPWTPPSLTAIRREGPNVTLEWKAQPGSTNVVEVTSRLGSSSSPWVELGAFSFPGASCSATDSTTDNAPQRFYRVKRLDPAPCPCPMVEE